MGNCWSERVHDNWLHSEVELLKACKDGSLQDAKKVVMKMGGVAQLVENPVTRHALHVCAHFGRDDVLDYLLKQGWPGDHRHSASMMTPLHFAASEGHRFTCQVLIEGQASVNKSDQNGIGPIHLAASQGWLSIVKYLYESGAYLEATEKNGYTPLHLAAAKGHTEIVEYLLLNGADITLKSKRGKIPSEMAKQNDPALVEMLKKAMMRRAEEMELNHAIPADEQE